MSRDTHKQIQVYIPKSEFVLIRDEAARLSLSTTELLRRWINPYITKIKKKAEENNGQQ